VYTIRNVSMAVPRAACAERKILFIGNGLLPVQLRNF
jgi:hypothetical protein